MKKVTAKKPKPLEPPPPQKSKSTRENKTLKPSQSEESLTACSKKNAPQRKASTPTHELSTRSVSPDISCILTNSKPLKGQINTEKPSSEILQEKAAPVGLDLQETLDFEYNRYLQAVFKNKLEKATSYDIDTDLSNLQKRISANQRILQQTSERLKNISFNKEVDLLHSLQTPNYGKALETLDSSNCEEYLTRLHEKLEQSHNQLRVKNMELPQGGGAQLLETITDTVAALEKLRNNHDLETPRVLAEIKKSNRSTVNSLLRCTENLPAAEDLMLTRATLEITARNKT